MTLEAVRPKFQTVYEGRNVPKHKAIPLLATWCNAFHEYNLAPPYKGGSYGNMSFRYISNRAECIITGTNIGLKDNLEDNCFVRVLRCDLNNGIVYVDGLREPSSEAMLHWLIYHARPEVMAIFHGHSAPLLQHGAQLEIPETKVEQPYGSIELVKEVLEIAGLSEVWFLNAKNHGFFSLGRNLNDAGQRALDYLTLLQTVEAYPSNSHG